MNKVVLIGRMVADPELRFAAGSGMAISRFRVAVNRRKKEDGADFINCVSFGKTAETIAQYFTKGRQIAVTGNIRTGSYDAQDGTKRYTTDVAVESFEFVGSNGQASNQGSNNTDAFSGFSEFGGFDDVTPADDMGDCPF
ncbi:single-stranded DNA-binding protein [Clostridium sp.]|uniref:single-stranded DNA-binding protein n=1 Tax=Clostridium sp. TaxID=1506 RepID=UPI00290D3AB2|nr:single-stranded DNA-binding protein [Clostridium sp.]MDU7212990.1 single-stranded DNA-binding protein [Clostridium sp.]